MHVYTILTCYFPFLPELCYSLFESNSFLSYYVWDVLVALLQESILVLNSLFFNV